MDLVEATKTMRIEGPGAVNPARSASFNSLRPSRSQGPDRTQLSGLASAIAESKGPEVIDQSRVDRLRQAIADGSFQMDPAAIAKRMLSEEVG